MRILVPVFSVLTLMWRCVNVNDREMVLFLRNKAAQTTRLVPNERKPFVKSIALFL